MAFSESDGKATSPKRLILILGGARSGKSSFAEDLAQEIGKSVVYVATAAPLDEEMRQRIEKHRARRPAGWQTVEAPYELTPALVTKVENAEVILLDCMSVFVSNLLVGDGHDHLDESSIDLGALETGILSELEGLLELYRIGNASLIVVSNEVGMGIVPVYPLGRTYRDLLGRANQFLAQRADEVYVVFAGLPVELKALVKAQRNVCGERER